MKIKTTAFLTLSQVPHTDFLIEAIYPKNDHPTLHYRFKIQCVSRTLYDISTWHLKPGRLTWGLQNVRHGVITQVTLHENYNTYYLYEITLSSPLALLKQSLFNRVFSQQSLSHIINTLFNSAHFPLHSWHSDADLENVNVPYQVQYQQNNYDFLNLIRKKYGVAFTFEQTPVHFLIKFYTHKNKKSSDPVHYHFLSPAQIQSEIDQKGRYITQFLCGNTLALQTIQPGFMHFPHDIHTPIITRYINGDINQPIISGAVLNNNTGTQTLCQTHKGQKIIMDDQMPQNAIKINDAIQFNTNIKTKTPEIFINAPHGKNGKNGKIGLLSGNNNTINTHSFYQIIKQDCFIKIKHQQKINAENTLYFYSGNNINLRAQKNITLNANHDIHTHSNAIQFLSDRQNNPGIFFTGCQNFTIGTASVNITGNAMGLFVTAPRFTINASLIRSRAPLCYANG